MKNFIDKLYELFSDVGEYISIERGVEPNYFPFA